MGVQKQRRRLFRIFYSTSFTFVFLLLLAFVIVSPADAVWQSYKAARYLDVFIIAGVYVLTGIVAVLILASRLYTNRSVLASIPKTYMPIEPEDVGNKVRKMVKESLDRSAVIAFNVRPKVLPEDVDRRENPRLSYRISKSSGDTAQQKQHTRHQQWKNISHPGWSSPCSPDLPHLQYDTVVVELPALIEAKAVSLAPADPAFAANGSKFSSEPFTSYTTAEVPAIPAGRTVDVLQRPENMGVREYVEYLMYLGIVQPASLGKQFLGLYESARFSGKPLTEEQFRRLMSVFAEVLRSMTHIDPDIIAQIRNVDPLDSEADTEGYETPTPASEHSSIKSSSQSSSSMSTAASWQTQRRYNIDAPTDDSASDSTRSLRTAPLNQPRGSSWAQSRSVSRPQMTSRLPSGNSLRPARSNASMASQSSARSGGSVIRLAARGDGHLNLPYVIDMDK